LKNGIIGIISDKGALQHIDSSEVAISRPSRFGSLQVSFVSARKSNKENIAEQETKNLKNGIIGIISDKDAPQIIDSSDVTIYRLPVSGSIKVSKLFPGLNCSTESRLKNSSDNSNSSD
jgi:hypothetical protein